MIEQPDAVVVYTTQPAVVTVVELESVKELLWFKEALESGVLLYPIAGERTIPELRLNAGGTDLLFEQWSSTYEGVEKVDVVIAQRGRFVAWNQSQIAYVGDSSSVKAFPSILFKPVVIPA